MNAKRILIPLVNLIIFVAAGLILYKFANGRSGPGIAADVGEEPTGPTNVPVRVSTVTRQTLRRVLTAFGQVEPAAAGSGLSAGGMSARAPFAGVVSAIHCVEGQHVESGAVLFTMDSRSADADIRQAQAILSASQATLDRLQQATEPQKSPEWTIAIARWGNAIAQANLDRAKGQEDLLTVKASISGIVQAVRVGPGEGVAASVVVVDLIDPARVVLALQMPGFLAGDVKIGQAVFIDPPGEIDSSSGSAESPATKPSPLEAKVRFVDPSIDAATGLTSIDVALPSGMPIKPGQFLRGAIVIEEHPDCLAVPAEAIVRDAAGRPEIGIVSPDEHQAILHRVETGIRQDDLVEVRSDWLQPGDTVVTAGASALVTRTGIQVVGH